MGRLLVVLLLAVSLAGCNMLAPTQNPAILPHGGVAVPTPTQ